ncbi:MAG: hypothetical protein AMS25_04180 [Gemmatimonas sp. SM23_52]|nr:MAG: hypothetical protein AMS25_04180 [Gemmatimonas sp. SM23_52]
MLLKNLALALCCCMLPGIAWAQEADSLQRAAHQRLEARINSQKRIRVLTAWGPAELYQPVLDGEALTYWDGRLVGPIWPGAPKAERVLPEGFPQALQLSEVSQIQVRGTAMGTGFLTGAVVLGTIGLVAGMITTRPCDPNEWFCEADAGDVVTMTLFSAAVGGGVGALVGAMMTRWKTVYRAPGSRAP